MSGHDPVIPIVLSLVAVPPDPLTVRTTFFVTIDTVLALFCLTKVSLEPRRCSSVRAIGFPNPLLASGTGRTVSLPCRDLLEDFLTILVVFAVKEMEALGFMTWPEAKDLTLLTADLTEEGIPNLRRSLATFSGVFPTAS